METIYKARRLRSAGAVIATLFTMLLLSSYVAEAQDQTSLYVDIECYGIVKAKNPGDIQVVDGYFNGPSFCVAPLLGENDEVWALKPVASTGYSFVGWATTGYDVPLPYTLGPPPYPLTGNPDPEGFTWAITMADDKHVRAIFEMNALPDPGMIMSDGFTINTIPGTDEVAKGTPVIVPLTATYPTISAGLFPGVRVDALLHTDRTGGFDGLRILDISPAPGVVGTIDLGTVAGVFGDYGNDILLSDIFDIITSPSDFIAPLLEDESGKTINWVFTFDGFMEEEVFTVTISTVAYKDAALEFGDELCPTVLADSEFEIEVAEVEQTLTADTPIIECGGPFEFSTTITYPIIQNIDLAGEILANAILRTDKAMPAGTTITWTYAQTPGGSFGPAVYTALLGSLPANTDIYLSDIIQYSVPAGTAPTPLVGHSELEVVWNFSIANIPSGSYNLTVQPIVQLDEVDYPYGDVLSVELINLEIIASVEDMPTAISAVTKAPIIVPVTSTFATPYSDDHDGIAIDGRIKISSGTFPTGMEIIGARFGEAIPPTFDIPIVDGLLGGTAGKKISEIFGMDPLVYPYDLEDSGPTTYYWEFDIAGISGPVTFNMIVELFTYYEDSDECIVGTDNVNITFANASYTVDDDMINGCLNWPIPFNIDITYPAIANIEPSPAADITHDVILTFDRDIVKDAELAWGYEWGTWQWEHGVYTFDDPLAAGEPLLLSTIVGETFDPWLFQSRNGKTDNWDFFLTIGNHDNDEAMSLGGVYNITVQPYVGLEPYEDDFNYLPEEEITLNIPYNTLTMEAEPDFAGTTDPEVGDYEVACGAIWDINAEPSLQGGWGFNFWSDDACPHSFIGNPFHAGTTYKMPNCDAVVTANFIQKVYTLTIGVKGCGQDVVIWPEYGSTAIATLNGNRECAILDENGGWDPLIPRTFTHGETVILEVIPEEGWTWGQWVYCSPTEDDEPLSDPDFTYLGINEDGHHYYELIFRSDKDLKAIFLKNLTAFPVVADKVYDSQVTATITGGSYTGFITDCDTYCSTLPWYQEGATAVFTNEHVGTDIPVVVSNLTLGPTGWDCGYILGPTTNSTITGYGIANTTFNTDANITCRTLTVGPLVFNDKVYDGTTSVVLQSSSVGGFVSGDDIAWAITNYHHYDKNVGNPNPKEVYYEVTLSKSDAVNYCLPTLPKFYASITCRPLVVVGIQACPKEYDGTTAATICNWGSWKTGVGQGIVTGECVHLNTSGYVATFEDIFVDDLLNVTVTGLSIDGVGCLTGHKDDWKNYCLEASSTGTGTIQVPPYAMFDPSYQYMCGTACEPDIVNVPVERNFTVAFDRPIYTNQGLQLPTSGSGMGNFIRLEKWIGEGTPPCHVYNYPDEDWVYVPFWSTRNGQVITVYPGTPETETKIDLEWNTYYRVRFGDIWAYNDLTDVLVPVIYRLDQNGLGVFDNTQDCAIEQSKQIIFQTIPQLISPVVEPSGCVAGVEIPYNAPIKITFVNPVKYTNGNMITAEVGEPTHKFQLQAKSKYGSPSDWTDVIFQATASQFEEALPGTYGPRVITLVPLANLNEEYPTYMAHPGGEMLHCYDYRVVWRDGMADDGAGFIDMCDFGRVGANEFYNQETMPAGTYLPWTWCTTCKFDIQVSYQANSSLGFPGAPSTPIKNNMYLKQTTTLKDLNLNGTNYAPNGKELTYKVNMLSYPNTYKFESFIGNGYHINNWTRNTGVWYNYSSWKYQGSDPGLAWDLFTNQNQIPAPPVYPVSQHPFINWVADPAVPFSMYRFNVVYDINTYTILAKADPTQVSSSSGVSFTGSTPFFGSVTTTKGVTHGDNVMITARPKLGMYTPSWSYNPAPSPGKSLPASVQATVVATNYWYNPELPAKPNFVTPKDGTISFKMVGTDPIHTDIYTVQANFAEFFPRVDVTVEPEMPDCNYVTYTAQFVQGQNWGIKYASNNYAVFFYGTPITLTPHVCECGWEFSHYEVWDGTYTNPPSNTVRKYVPFYPTEWMPVIANLDIKAIFVKTAYHITAVTDPNTKGSVLIEGENADGDFVELIDAAAAAGDDFIFDTQLTLTVYPEPGWECVGFNNDNVSLVEEYIDRSVWSYVVGANDCEQPYDLVAELELRQYVIKGLPYYNNTQNTTGGKVTGAPAGTGLNTFTNSSSAGTAIGTFEHFQHPATFTLTATANDYYTLSHWYDVENGVSLGSANPLSLPMVNADRTIRAIFVVDLPTYPLTVTNDPADAGYESVTQNGSKAYEPYEFYKHGQLGFPSVISVTAIPEIGWEFDYWTSSLFTGKNYSNPYVFNMPDNAVTMVAHYKKIDYELDLVCRTYLRPVDPCNCNIEDYGLILEDVTPARNGIYNFGDVVTLKATPIPGFTFVNWMVGTLSDLPGCGEGGGERSGDCILTGWQIDPVHAPRPYPQTMTFTYTIPAQWEETVVLYALAVETAFPQYPIYSLTTSANPDGYGNTWGDGNYPETVVAMVDQEETTPGWGFQHWDVNYTTQAEGVSPLGIYMDEDKDAVAHYELIEYELDLVAIGCGSVYAQDWDYLYNIEDDPIPVHAEEDCCNYEFGGWFYDYNCVFPVVDGTGTPITAPDFGFIPVAEDVTIYGLFVETFFDVEITQASDECGSGLLPLGCTAEVISGDGPWALDEVITLLATPGPGYVFDYWANPMCEVLIEDEQFNHTILCQWNDFVAVFDAIPYNVTVTANPTAGGTVAGGGIYYIGNNVTVTATPTVGWEFNGWYDGSTLKSSNPSYSFTMPAANVSLEARFTITTVTLTVTIDGPSSTSVIVKNGSTVLTPPYEVNYGTQLTLDPEPNGLFLNWTGDLTGTANPATLAMNGNKAVVAHFAACDPVTNLASTTTAKSATVTWTTPSGQTAELRYKKAVGGTWTAWAAATSPKTITGLTPGTLYDVELRTVCGTGIYSSTVAGTFTTKLLGDVNCDGVVNVLDVIVLTNYIMGTQASTPCILEGGDLNGDGQINVLDVVSLINIVLGNNDKGTVMSVPADIYLTPGVIMLSSDGTLAGLQFELTGPQVRDLNLTLNLEGFQLLYTVEGNTLSGMIYNLDNEPLPAGMINLVTMKGDGIIEWGHVIGANFGESEVPVNKHGALDDEFTLMVYPNPSQGAINALFSVPYDSKVNIRLLDFSGRVISELTDAVYTYGEHLINWTNSQTLTTGLYILQMNAVSDDAPDKVFRQEVKVVIIK